MSARFKLLLVDYDDTAKMTEAPLRQCWASVFAEFGVPFNARIYFEINARNQLFGDYLADWIGEPRSKFEELEKDVRAEIKARPLTDGAIELTDRARSEGAIVWLWTDSSEQWVLDTSTGAQRSFFEGFYFDAQKSSHHSVVESADSVGCHVSEVLGIDNAERGLKALRAAGANAIHYRPQGQESLAVHGFQWVQSLLEVNFKQPVQALREGLQSELSR